MSGTVRNRIESDQWRYQRSRKTVEPAMVRNRRKSRLSGRRHKRQGFKSPTATV